MTRQWHRSVSGRGMWLVVTVVAAAAVQPLVADEAEKEQKHPEKRFDRLDKDGDGTLSREEFQAHDEEATRAIDPQVIQEAAGTEATTKPGGVVRIGWVRDDVDVTVDGTSFPPAAGLGSWAAFKPAEHGGAIVMGDTVVFRDEVDAAMDAAFAHGLKVTALHNHFFYDKPKAYFMHISGRGEPKALAKGVKAMWDAIKKVRAKRP